MADLNNAFNTSYDQALQRYNASVGAAPLPSAFGPMQVDASAYAPIRTGTPWDILLQHFAQQDYKTAQEQAQKNQLDYEAQKQQYEQKRKAAEFGLEQAMSKEQQASKNADILRQEKIELIKKFTPESVKKYYDTKDESVLEIRPDSASSPYITPYNAAQGTFAWNSRTGKFEPAMFNGQQLTPAQYDPALAGQLAGAKEGGKVRGGAQAQAELQLPYAKTEAENVIKQVDELLAHPGFETAVGMGSEITQFAPAGTATKDFLVRRDQLLGKQFLQAYETLKGGGQITEVEGKKATDAMSRMSTAASENEFRVAAEEFKTAIRDGFEKLRQKAGGTTSPAETSPKTSATPPIDKLKEGVITTFKNGSRWTLRNGQAAEVK